MQKYYDFINTENFITFKIRERFDRYSTNSHRLGYLEYEKDNIVTYAINKNNDLSKSLDSILSDVIYSSEDENLVIVNETNDLIKDDRYKKTKIFDINLKFISQLDQKLQYFIPLIKNNEKIYLAGDEEKAYIFDKDLHIIYSFYYENNENYEYLYMDNNKNHVVYQNHKGYRADRDIVTHLGSAIYTLSIHNINITDYLLFSEIVESIPIDNQESIEFRDMNIWDIHPYNSRYGIYVSNNKAHKFYSYNFVKVFDDDMIQASDDIYYNMQGEKIWSQN